MSDAPDAGRDAASARDTDAAVGGKPSDSGSADPIDAATRDAAVGGGGMDAQIKGGTSAGGAGGASGKGGAGGSMSTMDAGMDASANDAATSDAAISDAGTDAWVGSGLLCPPDALFCDGYEDSDFTTTWDYSILMPPATAIANQSTTMVHSGVGALHSKTGAAHAGTSTTNAARWGKGLIYNHQTSGDVWARWYYYVPTSTSVTTFFSAGVIAEREQPYFGFSLIIHASSVDVGVGDMFYPGTVAFPRDRWVCVELHAAVAAAPSGVFELYLDGTRQIQVTDVNTLPNMGYSTLDIGIHYTEPNQGPVEAYADDVAAGTTRLGCVP